MCVSVGNVKKKINYWSRKLWLVNCSTFLFFFPCTDGGGAHEYLREFNTCTSSE